jgi:succinate dehydrogenase/fumarate reductase cytochrome b subunit
MTIPILSTWIVGGLEGYASRNGGLSASTVAGTIGVASLLESLSGSETMTEYVQTKPLSVVMGCLVFFGSIFFLGYQIGNGIRTITDREESKEST